MDLLFQLLISGLFRYFHPHLKKSKNRKRHPHIKVSPSESSFILSSSKRNSEIPCLFRSQSLNNQQRKMSSSLSSSQKTSSPSPAMVEDRENVESMQAEALKVTPLRAIATDPEKVKKLRTRNARRSQAYPSGKTSVPSSSVPPERVNPEEFRSAHVAIARIVMSILNENQYVPGVSVPLNEKSASPSLAVDPDVTEDVKTSGDHNTSPIKNNEDHYVKETDVGIDDAHNNISADKEDETSDSILEKSPAKCCSDKATAGYISDSVLEESPAKCSSGKVPDDYISDSILEKSPVQESNHLTEPPVIDLDEMFSDNDLISNVNPSIAKRMMKRKGKQAVTQSPEKDTEDV